MMQSIAAENNLSETAFFVPEGDSFGLRWFTPTVEVGLCGHGTLAAAHVLFNELGHDPDNVLRFQTRSGELQVSQGEQGICLNFPVYQVEECELDAAIVEALGGQPVAAYDSAFRLYRYNSAAEVLALAPDMHGLLAASDSPVIATAPGNEVDFVSRFFGPQVGIDEDPVTGSAHCALLPLWVDRLGKNVLQAQQVSVRVGDLSCELVGERVKMCGYGLTFLRGQIELSL